MRCAVEGEAPSGLLPFFLLPDARRGCVIVVVTMWTTRPGRVALGVVAWIGLSAFDPSVRAEPPVLFLSPADALDVIRTRPATVPPAAPARRLHDLAVPAAPTPDIVPSRFHIPDLYAIDYDRDAPRFADPIDRDNMVAIEVFGIERHGVGMFLDYDEESFPIGDDGDYFAVRFERLF
jgi:hypothetical protein